LKDRGDGLLDEAHPGRPRTIDDDQVAAVIERTLRTTPVDATQWSIRSMAAETRAFIDLHNENPKPFKWTKSWLQLSASAAKLSRLYATIFRFT
jgi:hypothetical protein